MAAAAASRRIASSLGWRTSASLRAVWTQRTGAHSSALRYAVAMMYPVAVPGARGRCYSGHAGLSGVRAGGRDLLSCVEEEIALEQEVAESLPEVTGFTTTISGCLATLHRTDGSEKVVVELDANYTVPEELSDDEGGERELFLFPAFTISIINSLGSRLQIECSFDQHDGESLEQGKEWDHFNINSLSLLPANCPSPDTAYSVSAENMSMELYDGLIRYLETRGIDQRFASDICHFYRVHEHSCYLEQGLKALRKFIESTT